jgi:hypothetical protein
MIIGIAGNKHSGKDTAGAYFVKEHGFERVAFAHPMKKSIASLFDIPYSVVERYKDDHRVTVVLGIRHAPGEWEPIREMTFRQFHQYYGTEAHRDIPEIGDDFWVDLVMPADGFYDGRNIIVTDVRFTNEAARIHYLGGTIIKVSRPRQLVEQDPHRSETIMTDFDYHIDNNGTVEELYEKLENVLVKAA